MKKKIHISKKEESKKASKSIIDYKVLKAMSDVDNFKKITDKLNNNSGILTTITRI